MDKIVLITKKTALEELVERYNTREQARFYVEHSGDSFGEYQAAHDTYARALDRLRQAVPTGVRTQSIDRSFLPTFTFGAEDLVVTLGPDGLVVNAAKYLDGQPLLAFNPDPARIDGVLLPFTVDQARRALTGALTGKIVMRAVSMAQAALNDGQTLCAVNDLFIGRRTHVSARYRLIHKDIEEEQSSSGIVVSTGAGSTGWLRSMVMGAVGIVSAAGFEEANAMDSRFDWEEETLCFGVREPFPSKTSRTGLVWGRIGPDAGLTVISQMPQDGVIFGDGMEEDFLQFNSGATARIGLAPKKLKLIVQAGR